MLDQIALCQEMALVRNRGLVNAVDLGHEVERLGDWREHVRAHPVPLAVLAAAVGYWMIPSRPHGTGAPGFRSAGSPAPASSAPETILDQRETKTAGIAGMGGAAMGFVGSLVGNAVRSYVADQLQTLLQNRGSHALQSQRQAPSPRG